MLGAVPMVTFGDGMSSDFAYWSADAVPPALLGVFVRQISIANRSGQDETVSDWTAADFVRELAMLAYVRARLRASEGDDVGIPTTAVDQVLDELHSLERSPWDRN